MNKTRCGVCGEYKRDRVLSLYDFEGVLQTKCPCGIRGDGLKPYKSICEHYVRLLPVVTCGCGSRLKGSTRWVSTNKE